MPVPASTSSIRSRMTKVPRLPSSVVTQIEIPTLAPSRVTSRDVQVAVPVPESDLMAPARSGVSTNLPNEVGLNSPCAVIATRCFAASGAARQRTSP